MDCMIRGLRSFNGYPICMYASRKPHTYIHTHNMHLVSNCLVSSFFVWFLFIVSLEMYFFPSSTMHRYFYRFLFFSYSMEVDLVCGVRGAHGGYDTTAKVRDVRKIGGGRGLRGGPGKRLHGVFPRRPQSLRYQRRSAEHCSPGRRGEWRRTAEKGAERFMTK